MSPEQYSRPAAAVAAVRPAPVLQARSQES